MELFWLEHKKLWRKKIVKICVLLCFVYCVIFGSILSFQWFSFGSSDDYTSAFGNNFDGYTVIKDSQEYALSFGGELTDETLQQIVSDYQQMEADGMEKELEKTDWQIVNSWLGTLYPELRDTSNYKTMISYVDPDKLTGFYERRQQVLDEFLEVSGLGECGYDRGSNCSRCSRILSRSRCRNGCGAGCCFGCLCGICGDWLRLVYKA